MKTKEYMKKAVDATVANLYDFKEPVTTTLMKYSENFSFLVTTASEKHYVLRVNRPRYHTKEELLGELSWMVEIGEETDLVLPKVYCGKDGSLLQSLVVRETGVEYTCCLFSYLSGKMIKDLKGEEQRREMYEIGKILATLHNEWQYRDPKRPMIKRFHWNEKNLLGRDSLFGDWRAYPELDEVTYPLFLKTVERLLVCLRQFGKNERNYGMIHADLHRSNIIMKDDVLQIFDFDDCGYGWYLYDLGCTLVEYTDGVDELLKNLLAGYETIRPLSEEERRMAKNFVLIRRIVRMGWLTSHAQSDTAKLVDPRYFMETCLMAREFLNQIP